MATIVSDFIQIVGDAPVTIGDAQPVWEATFDTGGRVADATTILIFNVRGQLCWHDSSRA